MLIINIWTFDNRNGNLDILFLYHKTLCFMKMYIMEIINFLALFLADGLWTLTWFEERLIKLDEQSVKNEDNYMWITFAIGYSLHIVQNSYISENVVWNYFFFDHNNFSQTEMWSKRHIDSFYKLNAMCSD